MQTAELPRDKAGRFLPSLCQDPNCEGVLVRDVDRFGRPIWRCDGLTHDRDDGPLRACEREHATR